MPKFEYDYYSGIESEQFRFLRIPKVFFEDPDYDDLGLEEMVLYGFLHEQVDLSHKKGWVDGDGRTYVIRSLQSIQDLLRCKEDKARTVLKNLVDYGLIEKKRRGQGKPDLIYVKNFISKKSEKSECKKSDDCGKLFSESEKTKVLSDEKSDSKAGKIRALETGKSVPKDPNNNYTKITETPSFPQDTEDYYRRPLRITSSDGWMEQPPQEESEYELYAEVLKDNLDYDNTIRSLKYHSDQELFEEFYGVMLETMIGKTKYYTINDTQLPAEVVKSQMMKLTGDKVLLAMSEYSKVEDKIYNVKGYMRSVLYNASLTTQAFITNDVRYGMYGGGWRKQDEEAKRLEEKQKNEELERMLGII